MTAIDECWVWRGTVRSDGYGTKKIKQKQSLTHRLAWEWANGPIPAGMFVCHRCDNPPCCNPQHLYLGTHIDNMADMVAKRRHWRHAQTHCRSGHDYNTENTRISAGRRQCRVCNRARVREYEQRKRAAV